MLSAQVLELLTLDDSAMSCLTSQALRTWSSNLISSKKYAQKQRCFEKECGLHEAIHEDQIQWDQSTSHRFTVTKGSNTVSLVIRRS